MPNKHNKKYQPTNPIITNKKAHFNYEILNKIEAGIMLQGSEIKSIREKKINIVDSFATFKSGEIFITNLRIEPYQNASYFNHESTRPRKLLLKKKEIHRLIGKVKEKGIVIIPLKFYFDKQWVKVLLGICKGKKKHDKRHVLKERNMERDFQRELKDYV